MRYNPETNTHVNEDGLIAKPTVTDKLKTGAKYAAGAALGATIGAVAGYLYSKIPIEAYNQSHPSPVDNNIVTAFRLDGPGYQENLRIGLNCIYYGTGIGAVVGAIGSKLMADRNLTKRVESLSNQGYSLSDIIKETGRGEKKIRKVLSKLNL